MADSRTNLVSDVLEPSTPVSGVSNALIKPTTRRYSKQPNESTIDKEESLTEIYSDDQSEAGHSSDTETDEAVESSDNESIDSVKSFLIHGHDLSLLKIDEIKFELGKRGLKKTGNKSLLLERLKEHISNHEVKPDTETTHNIDKQQRNPDSEHQPYLSIFEKEIHDVKLLFRNEIDNLRQEMLARSFAPTGGSLQEVFTRINPEVCKLQAENRDLQLKLLELESRHQSLKIEAKILSDENKSLITAMRLLNNDNNSPLSNQGQTQQDQDELFIIAQNSEVNISSDQESEVNKKKKKKKKSKDKVFKNQDVKRISKNDNQSTKANVKQPNLHTTQQQQTAPDQNKPITVIAGDSIIQNIRGWELSKTSKVVVKSFPGATIQDMEDYIKPLLRKEPDNIILHIGTNNVKAMEPSQIVDGICRLAKQVDEGSTNTTISISGLLTRKEEDLNQKIIKVNSTMKAKCRQQGWSFLPNNNINKLSLNRGGLHLNPKGTSMLSKNFTDHIGK